MITKICASFIISILTISSFPFSIGKGKIDIKNKVSKGEAIIAVEKMRNDVAYERLAISLAKAAK